MKKSPFITAYCIFVVLVFISTLMFFGISLGKAYKKGNETAKSKYNIYSTSVVETLKLNTSQNLDLNQILNGDKISYNDFAYLNIKINGKDIYTFPLGKPEPQETNKYVKRYFDSYKIGETIIYTGAYVYLLSPVTIAFYCKISFIIILIWTIITILIIVYKSFSENEDQDEIEETDGFDLSLDHESESKENITTENTETEEIIHSENFDPLSKEELSEAQAEECSNIEESENTLSIDEYEDALSLPVHFEEIPENNETVIIEEEKTESEEIKETENPEPKEECEEQKEISEQKENEIPLPVQDYIPEANSPSGLYSEITGFGWESYLKPRLENELVRATSSEFDLCLFIIQIEGAERTSQEVQEISKILLSYFQFKDMIFEYKEDSFAAIKTNMIIDDAIKMSDNLWSDIQNVLQGTDIKCYIGISSKTIRMIGAERILKEANAAVDHAHQDPECPIMAFRADAEKYMEFVENN